MLLASTGTLIKSRHCESQCTTQTDHSGMVTCHMFSSYFRKASREEAEPSELLICYLYKTMSEYRLECSGFTIILSCLIRHVVERLSDGVNKNSTLPTCCRAVVMDCFYIVHLQLCTSDTVSAPCHVSYTVHIPLCF